MQWKDYIAAIAERGLTQKQLADKAGCGQATISDIASGKTRDPRSSIGFALIRIGKRLGIKANPTTTPTKSEAAHG
ncbi:helix-turn-helix transcriptional regulator [Diaphorobacter sp. HDW4B]|uniref:helix-turn-helix domain-containing protein n=1 Tax=Diaphorobacter sp. HDW4B TaxID=2714925 RepID=UPI001407E285|nr:helix-turn-helix transcriptional regulator [Diaphorobacter sp. HDW4B]QIL72293.1 helix-turn-helix transcriptional regulator [Diaphorobacter sp. HDW4B]